MNSQEEQFLLKEKYDGIEGEKFAADKQRLGDGEPLAYVIGHVPFLDTTIYLDSHPLIPRPETEFWVEEAIAAIRKSGASAPRILDLCAGSGAIGVAVAKAIPNAHITFAEIDKAHLPTIAKNLDTNDISCTRYQVFQSDLFSNLTRTDLVKFDLILSNPPYIDPVVDRAEQSVKAHEPHLALYGGEAGMELIRRIITEAPQHLMPHGQLWIEHEPEQTEHIEQLAHEYGFSVATHEDQYGMERFSILQRHT